MTKKHYLFIILTVIFGLIALFIKIQYFSPTVEYTVINNTGTTLSKISISTSDNSITTETSQPLLESFSTQLILEISKVVDAEGYYIIEATTEQGETYTWKNGYYSTLTQPKVDEIDFILSSEYLLNSDIKLVEEPLKRNLFSFYYPTELIPQTAGDEPTEDEGLFYFNDLTDPYADDITKFILWGYKKEGSEVGGMNNAIAAIDSKCHAKCSIKPKGVVRTKNNLFSFIRYDISEFPLEGESKYYSVYIKESQIDDEYELMIINYEYSNIKMEYLLDQIEYK